MSFTLFRIVRYQSHGDQEQVTLESPAEATPNQSYDLADFLEVLDRELGGKVMVYFDVAQNTDHSRLLADLIESKVELLYIRSPLGDETRHKFDDIEQGYDPDDDGIAAETLEAFDAAIAMIEALQAPELPPVIAALRMDVNALMHEVLKCLVWVIETIYLRYELPDTYNEGDAIQSLLALIDMAWYGWEEGLSIDHGLITKPALRAILDCIGCDFLFNQVLQCMKHVFNPYLVGEAPTPADETNTYRWLSELDMPSVAFCLSQSDEDNCALTIDDLLKVFDRLLQGIDPADESPLIAMRRERLSDGIRALLEHREEEVSYRWIINHPRSAKLLWQEHADHIAQDSYRALFTLSDLCALMRGDHAMSLVDAMELYLTLQYQNTVFFRMDDRDMGGPLRCLVFHYNVFMHLQTLGWEGVLFAEPHLDRTVLVTAGMTSHFFDCVNEVMGPMPLGTFAPGVIIEMIRQAHHTVNLTAVIKCLPPLRSELSSGDLLALMDAMNRKLYDYLAVGVCRDSFKTFKGMLAFYEYTNALKDKYEGFGTSAGYRDFETQIAQMIQVFIEHCLPQDASVSVCFDALMLFNVIPFFECHRDEAAFQPLSRQIAAILMAQPSESFPSGGVWMLGQFGSYRGERGWAAKRRLRDAFPTYQPEESGYITEASMPSSSDDDMDIAHVVSPTRFGGIGARPLSRGGVGPSKTAGMGLNHPSGRPASGLHIRHA